MQKGELLRKLGHPEDARLCIISCDSLGFSHSHNVAAFDALTRGIATTARLVANAPWSREVSSLYRGQDLGIGLVLTSDHDIFRMAPLTQSPTLVDGAGELPRTLEDFWEHADTAEVRRECRAQVERAIFYGLDPSHLASEAQALTLRPEFFDVLIEVALEFGLPVRVPMSDDPATAVFPAAELAAEAGVFSPDGQVCTFDSGPGSHFVDERVFEETLASLTPGVSEISFRPAVASDELTALYPQDWERFARAHLFLTSPLAQMMLADHHVSTIGYRELKQVQAELTAP
ncbi:MAG: ChbG/HpnK family deacetylase [Actinomycetota bacterium]|nr:ChbG/HpnK family deacetylase [Actinomycetota bacterium]